MVQRQKRKGMVLDTLREALEKSWGKETSVAPEKWSPENPAYGQCAVTALVVHDFFGGRLVKVTAAGPDETASHYYNELPDGRVVDLTRVQFPKGTTFSQPEYKERVQVEGRFPPPRVTYTTLGRYNKLRARVEFELLKR